MKSIFDILNHFRNFPTLSDQQHVHTLRVAQEGQNADLDIFCDWDVSDLESKVVQRYRNVTTSHSVLRQPRMRPPHRDNHSQ